MSSYSLCYNLFWCIGEEGHHRKRATEEGGDSHGGSSNDTDRTYCVQKCPYPWNPYNNTYCYGKIIHCYCLEIIFFFLCLSFSPLSLLSLACGINYCLDCNGFSDCTRCRNGTLLRTKSHPYHCIGNHSYEHTHSVGLIFCSFMPKQQNLT